MKFKDPIIPTKVRFYIFRNTWNNQHNKVKQNQNHLNNKISKF